MVARRTVPCSSERVRGAEIDSAPAEMAEVYMASRLSTSKATSVHPSLVNNAVIFM